MRFPGGTASLPDELTSSGRTGINGAQVTPPEQPLRLSNFTEEQLLRLADELEFIEADDREPSGVQEYARLVLAQVNSELAWRL